MAVLAPVVETKVEEKVKVTKKVVEKEKEEKEAAKAKTKAGLDGVGVAAAALAMAVVAWACHLQDMDIHLQDMVIHLQDMVIRLLDMAIHLPDMVTHLLDMVTHRQDMVLHRQDLVIRHRQDMADHRQDTATHLQAGMAIHLQATASHHQELQEVIQDAEDQALDQDLDQHQDQQELLVCHLAGSSITTLRVGDLFLSIGRLAKQHGIRHQRRISHMGHLHQRLAQHQDQDLDQDLDQDRDQDQDQQELLVCHLAGNSTTTLQAGGLISSSGRLDKQHGIRPRQQTSHRRRLRRRLHLQANLRQVAYPRAGNRQTTPKPASHITSTVPLGLQAGRRHSDLPPSLPGM